MEDQIEAQDTGVELASAAEVHEVEDHSTEQIETNPGVEHTDVADQNNEKGFAKALKAREEQIRSQLEQEYSGRSKEAERYQALLDRTAKLNGFADHEAYAAALDEYEVNQRIQEEADRLNVSEDVIREYIQPLKQELDELKGKDKLRAEEDMVRTVEAKLNNMESDTANYPDFAKHKGSILQYAAEKGYALEDAYKIVTFDDRLNSARMQAQQETIRNLQQNADSSTGSLGADAPEHAGGYIGMSPAEKKAFRDRVKSGTN